MIRFTDITDSLNQRAGNSFLKPELAHAVELSYDHSFKTGSVTASAFYRNTSNIILSYTTLDSKPGFLPKKMHKEHEIQEVQLEGIKLKTSVR